MCHVLYRSTWKQRCRGAKPPLRKKKAVMFTNVKANVYQRQLNAGFSKVCEIFKVHGIESLKYVESFTDWFVIVATFPRPKRDAEQN